MVKPWQQLGSETVWQHRIFDLCTERFVSPRTEQPLDAVVLACSDWVNVIGLTPAQEVVLIWQFRFGTREVGLEIPGGLVDPGESPLEAARRELLEETGYQATRWTPLGSIAPNPAIQRNRLHSFLAEDCQLAAELKLDPGEDLEVALRPLAEMPALLASGQIHHALVAVAFHKLDLLRAGYKLK
jgi:8-oxo-dGTP pyrophosphatase MutT (NUDIX family)